MGCITLLVIRGNTDTRLPKRDEDDVTPPPLFHDLEESDENGGKFTTKSAQFRNIKVDILQDSVKSLLRTHRRRVEDFEGIPDKTVKTKKGAKKTPCDQYILEGNMPRTVLPNVWGDLSTYDSDDVALITQTSHNRVERIQMFLDHWRGPISIAVNVDILDLALFFQKLNYCPSLFTRTNVDLHLVVQEGVSKENYLGAERGGAPFNGGGMKNI